MATIVVKSYERLGNNGEPIDEIEDYVRDYVNEHKQNWIL